MGVRHLHVVRSKECVELAHNLEQIENRIHGCMNAALGRGVNDGKAWTKLTIALRLVGEAKRRVGG